MKDRFEGDAGRRNLETALIEQEILGHKEDLVHDVADAGEIVQFADGDTIIEQGDSDTGAFFILAGSVKVFVNHREVEVRGPRQVVGEMVTVDPSAPRSATVKADGDVVALRIAGPKLEELAEANPSIWRIIARTTNDSLRKRERFHRPRNDRPVLFIGCSTEGLDIASEVQAKFKHEEITVRPWTDGVFGAGGVPLDNLMTQVEQADFALFVFTPDDLVLGRETEKMAPRDNVIFELGMFISRLGRNRAFVLREHKTDMKIPSDLLGITDLTYVSSGKSDLATELGPPCTELKKLFKGLGAL